jgi:hypothetical protein
MINKKVELLVEGKTVQLFGDESFSLSFSIDDINDIGKKSAAYSKEISIPATDINNAVRDGKIGDELVDVAVNSRNESFSGGDWADANKKVIDIIKNDASLQS